MQKKILIVDDEPTTVKYIHDMLIKEGFEVHTALNGLEGLKIVNRQDFDIIITDIIMPEMDGVDFYKALQKSSRTSSIPIIVITASTVIAESFRVLGVNDFLAKPLDWKMLKEKIDRLLSLKRVRLLNEKILIVGNDQDKVSEMEDILVLQGSTVWTEYEGLDALSRSLVMVPNIILLDVLLKDLSAREIIKALRCFAKLNLTRILLFNFYQSTSTGRNSVPINVNEIVSQCLANGADAYIGPYEKFKFKKALKENLAVVNERRIHQSH